MSYEMPSPFAEFVDLNTIRQPLEAAGLTTEEVESVATNIQRGRAQFVVDSIGTELLRRKENAQLVLNLVDTELLGRKPSEELQPSEPARAFHPDIRRRRREDREQAKLEFLGIGRELYLDGARPAIKYIADQAGAPVGLIYYYFRSKEEYERRLLTHIDDTFVKPRDEQLLDEGREAILSGESFSDVIKLVFSKDLIDLRKGAHSPHVLRLEIRLWSDVGENNDEDDIKAEAEFARMYQRRDEQWISFYRDLFKAFGLEPRPPFNYSKIAVIINHMRQGLAIHPALDLRTDEHGWNALSRGVLAFMIPAIRPLDDTADFWTAAEELQVS